jgi:single-stranded-DNA-specific exonuclease
MNNFDLFLERAKLCAKTILEMSHPTLITHYDCDGLCSGAIVCKFLEVNNIKYELKIVRKLDDEFLESLKNKQELIFSDLGGAAKKLNEFDSNIVIFDHHQTEGLNKLQLNPQLFGLDGGNEMSASSCVYWALEQLPEIALVGSIGDMQYPLKGANRTLAQKFEKMGILEIETDLKIYGRASRPLVQFP